MVNYVLTGICLLQPILGFSVAAPGRVGTDTAGENGRACVGMYPHEAVNGLNRWAAYYKNRLNKGL